MNRKTAKILAALTIVVAFVAGAFFSAALASVCFKHEHDHSGPGGSCAVCAQLTISGNLLKFMSVALVGIALGLGCLTAAFSAFRAATFHTDFTGLVRLKTRMNN